MKIWKSFLPELGRIEALRNVKPAPYFIDKANSPELSKIYLQSETGQWIVLAWDYFDIEFKFETYGISIEIGDSQPKNCVAIGAVPEFKKISLYVRTEWTRPTDQGEVPPDFVPIIEKSGKLVDVPENAISAGTSLQAVMFHLVGNESGFMIFLDEDVNYSLKMTSDPIEMSAIQDSCDAFDFVEYASWVRDFNRH